MSHALEKVTPPLAAPGTRRAVHPRADLLPGGVRRQGSEPGADDCRGHHAALAGAHALTDHPRDHLRSQPLTSK